MTSQVELTSTPCGVDVNLNQSLLGHSIIYELPLPQYTLQLRQILGKGICGWCNVYVYVPIACRIRILAHTSYNFHCSITRVKLVTSNEWGCTLRFQMVIFRPSTNMGCLQIFFLNCSTKNSTNLKRISYYPGGQRSHV